MSVPEGLSFLLLPDPVPSTGIAMKDSTVYTLSGATGDGTRVYRAGP